MYNNQEIALRIKETARTKKLSIKQLLDECGLNINYISQFANGKDMTAGNLYNIANLLDVSVDYLLGRTDTPTGYSSGINNAPTAETISAKEHEYMKSPQEIANTIKELAKAKKITIGKMLSDCELGVNTISSMQAGGFFPRLESINKIADYLDVSVDYLLGRTENPNISVVQTVNGNNNHSIATGIQATTNSENQSDEMSQEMLKQFNKLSIIDRSRVILYIDDLNRKKA